MIIKSIDIISFGKFQNKTLSFSDGLNIISGNNESGKSTIINFIYAILYGFGDNRGKTLSLREKYTPWNGGVCEGKITVQTDFGQNIVIYRKAGNAKKYDILRIYDADTGEEFSVSPDEITGISSDTFFKTLCIQQLSSAISGSNDEIALKLSNITSTGDESFNYEKAQKILEATRREIQPLRGSGGSLSLINQKIASAERSKNISESTESEIISLKRIIPSMKTQVKELRDEYDKLSKSDYTVSIAHLSGRIEEIKSQTEKKKRHLSDIASLIFFFTFLLLLFLKPAICIYPFILSALFIIPRFFNNSHKNNFHLRELTEKKENLAKQKAEQDKKLADIKERLLSTEEKLKNTEMKINSLELSLSTDGVSIEKLYEEKKILETKLQTVTLASEALKAAYENMQKNFTPALSKKASRYFSIITGGQYENIFCNKEFNVQIDAGLPRSSSFFSGGTVDQLYLSVRLALTDMLFGDKSCTLMLDQPFLQYDENRKKRTVELLRSLENNRQILLFTADNASIYPNITTEILT